MMHGFAAVMLVAALQGAMSIDTVALDNMSGVEEPRQAIARTQAEWTALWRTHAGDKPAPKVDFSKYAVAAVFLGSRPTAGYGVEISGLKTEGKTLTIEWRERRPEPGAILAQVMTSPAHIATIPRFDGEVVFKKAAQ